MIRALGAAIAAFLACALPRAAVAQDGQPPPEDGGEAAQDVPPEGAPAEQPPADDEGSSLDIGPIDDEPEVRRRDPDEGTGVDVLDVEEDYVAPVDDDGGRVVVRRANDRPPPPPLNEVADSPSARMATGSRMPLGPMTHPGSDFLPGYYRGVVPGQNHLPPRARRLRKTRVNYVTWPGFEPLANGSRIFVQSTRPLTYRRADEPNRIVLVLDRTRIHLRNNYNPLVTEHFNTPVAEAYLRSTRRGTVLVLEMKVGVVPRIRQVSEHGYHFLFLEFSEGNYPIPADVRRGYRLSERVRGRGGRR